MVDLDITEPAQKSTNLVNGLVVVEKPNGKLGVCLDPRPLKNHEMWTPSLPHSQRNLPNVRGILFFKIRRHFRLLAN